MRGKEKLRMLRMRGRKETAPAHERFLFCLDPRRGRADGRSSCQAEGVTGAVFQAA